MDNFDLKKYLAEGKLFKEEVGSFQYPEEILAMDKEIADLKAKLEAAITAKNKAKSNYTKTVPSLKDQDEYKGLDLPNDKRSQYRFKDLVDKVKKISDESGNNWDALNSYLKNKYGRLFDTYTTNPNPAAYVVNFFSIIKGEDEFIKNNPNKHIKIGDWYIRPW
jgi:hypothetical protein